MLLRRAVAPACILLLMLAGCAAPPPPTAEPTTTAVPLSRGRIPVRPDVDQPTPQGGAVAPPQFPDTDPGGALDFAHYAIQMYGYVLQTGDLTTWSTMVSPTCRACVDFTVEARELHNGGSWLQRRDETSIIATSGGTVTPPDLGDSDYTVKLDLVLRAQVQVASNGTVTEFAEVSYPFFEMEITVQGSRWAIADMDTIARG
ncbi:MAG: DUF6318 family protein [Beutenbergiaceae bacterium]